MVEWLVIAMLFSDAGNAAISFLGNGPSLTLLSAASSAEGVSNSAPGSTSDAGGRFDPDG